MAVKQANSNYHTFTFNGVRAADYGIYVTDVNVFNSAARDVEYIQIPGRDGAFALDRGRFQNISVVYKCAMTQDTDEDFATAISEFRNAIASTKGYKRLEDDIHTDEYRMGVFSKGLEAPTLNTKTATFDVEFNCQPQRFLKSGETAVSVASGGTINNPTLFESHPLLQVWGYGEVGINDESVEVMHVPVGNVLLAQSATASSTTPRTNAQTTTAISTDALNTGDDINVASVVSSVSFRPFGGIINTNIVYVSGGDGVEVQVDPVHIGRISIKYTPSAYQKGTGRTDTYKWRAEMTGVGSSTTYKVEVTVTVTYSTTGTVVVSAREINNFSDTDRYRGISITHGEITGYSTKSALGEPLYFSLDIGEAYKYEGDSIVSINNAVTIPAKLPVLKSGANTITYDDTITQFKIVPRWWEV